MAHIGWGRSFGRPASTVHRVLKRHGFSRLRDADRVTTAPIRYVACHPGALVHQDHKKLGRIPVGGGWRAIGQSTEVRRLTGGGYEHLEVVIDDASRFAVVVPVPDETAVSAVAALETAATELARHGIRIERVLTDNGSAYVWTAFNTAVGSLGARHKRTRPWRPRTNGKAERLIQTLLREWAYGRAYQSNAERAAALPVFVDFYNRRRPHTALGGRSPLDAINDLMRDHT
jgi:transposase InsO family protein